jgi:hypothetical protein
MCVCVCVYTNIHLYYIYNLYVCMYVRMISMCVCMYDLHHLYVLYVYMYVCMYVCIYVAHAPMFQYASASLFEQRVTYTYGTHTITHTLHKQQELWATCAAYRDRQVPLYFSSQVYSEVHLDIPGSWAEWSNNMAKQLHRTDEMYIGVTQINFFRVPCVSDYGSSFMHMAAAMATGEIDGVVFRYLSLCVCV